MSWYPWIFKPSLLFPKNENLKGQKTDLLVKIKQSTSGFKQFITYMYSGREISQRSQKLVQTPKRMIPQQKGLDDRNASWIFWCWGASSSVKLSGFISCSSIGGEAKQKASYLVRPRAMRNCLMTVSQRRMGVRGGSGAISYKPHPLLIQEDHRQNCISLPRLPGKDTMESPDFHSLQAVEGTPNQPLLPG